MPLSPQLQPENNDFKKKSFNEIYVILAGY